MSLVCESVVLSVHGIEDEGQVTITYFINVCSLSLSLSPSSRLGLCVMMESFNYLKLIHMLKCLVLSYQLLIFNL